MRHLIVGLGNPGKTYEGTRHNVGYRVLDVVAEKEGLSFQKKQAWKGVVAEGSLGSSSVILFKPLTFMNESGVAVAHVMRYLGLELSGLLVVVDDVAIPLGQLRMRKGSGSGGHNGLQNIEDLLQTNDYARLRIGVGDRSEGDLADYVLSRFAKDEERLLPQILERAVDAIKIWLEKGLTSAMDFANKKFIEPEHEEL